MKSIIEKLLIAIGICLIVLGIATTVPGAALTTYSFENGKDASDYYELGNTYTTIDEYVGGDAYNFIIGATLVGSMITGSMVTKALYISSGVIVSSMGLFLMSLDGEKNQGTTEVKPVQQDAGPYIQA